MATANDYKITFGYGRTDPPYSPTSPHRGNDRAMPIGTDVWVGGLLIGKSGNTGDVVPRPTATNPAAGAHLHTGKFVGGAAVNPGTDGAEFALAEGFIYDTGQDPTNGKYVRIFSNGAVYVYCHLSEILVTKNQQLTAPGKGAGDPDMPFISDAELADFRTWKTKGMYYENKLVPAMQADKQAWMKNCEAVQQQCDALAAKLTDAEAKAQVQTIKELCTIDVSSLPADDAGMFVKVVAWIQGLLSRSK
jgi:hypothetical protein